MPDPISPKLLGWREWLVLPALGIRAIRAKIDTGARSSSLHVESFESFDRAGAEWVRFLPCADCDADRGWIEAAVLDRRIVTDSGGHRSQRIFIRTILRLGGEEWPIELNLTRRNQLRFPMLLGRTAIVGRCWVDPARSFILGEPGATADRPALA